MSFEQKLFKGVCAWSPEALVPKATVYHPPCLIFALRFLQHGDTGSAGELCGVARVFDLRGLL